VLSRLKHAPAVIFTTAYDQFAVTAFEIGAIDYLLKPFGRERFGRAMERARPLLERQVGTQATDRAREVLRQGPIPRLFVRESGRIVPIRVASIEWIEACDDYVIVHTQGRHFRMNVPLSDLEKRLDPLVFVRVHRSHVVNLDHVVSWTPYDGSRFQITLRTGTTVMASRQRSRLLRDLQVGRRQLNHRRRHPSRHQRAGPDEIEVQPGAPKYSYTDLLEHQQRNQRRHREITRGMQAGGEKRGPRVRPRSGGHMVRVPAACHRHAHEHGHDHEARAVCRGHQERPRGEPTHAHAHAHPARMLMTK
jgi:two-component system LytT family response regulator